ncbi:DUF4430 domain-containing protein [Paenibacillus sp. FSL H8-0548]|uniref:DUF4430 domain-containing protein n=1 Tax=Paenibacillus sp. FSL H8-0548 TaxID=1920422 RepID=UPI00117EB5E1|nr:DUF4430 domain-containing protein [Paenibacillus sp. FSL H8-0548]
MITFNRFMKKMLPAMLVFVLIFGLFAPQVSKAADHTDNTSLNTMIEKTVDYYKNRNTELTSWWDLVALWGAGQNLSDGSWQLPPWYKTDQGLLPTASGTEHINYIFGLLAMGEDPAHAWETNRNLYAELAAQQNATTGAIGNGLTNRHMWAMLALDTGAKLGSSVGTWDAAAKQKAVDYLLSKQLSDGGFAFFGTTSDADMTGMGLLALGNYQNDSAVQSAIVKLKAFLKTKQLNGEHVMFGNNSNSMSAVVTGLTAIGEDVLSDAWTDNGNSILDSYALFQVQNGAFKYLESQSNADAMATNQSLIALLDTKYQKTVWHRFADIKLPVRVSVEVDGISDRIYEKNIVSVPQSTNSATALDALKYALDKATPAILYNIVNSSYGPYVQGIDEQEAGSLGGWDGWMYEVNGAAPDVGAGEYQLKENDKVRFYYSRYPAIATAAELAGGTTDPYVDVTLVGDDFSSEAISAENWIINTNSADLTVQSITSVNNQTVRIQLHGQVTSEPITIQALSAALISKQKSNTITLRIPVKASLQVDGISGAIFAAQEVKIKNTENPTTALDLLKKALDQAVPKISYEIVNSSFGPYVNAIDGQAAGSLGGWDGWMFEVNGAAPSVGAAAYELKENDEVRFYYSRWPALSTTTKIANGASNPAVEVLLAGDEFTNAADDISNWSIHVGSTELQVSSIIKDNNKVTISFEGTANGGAITIKALEGALVGNQASDPISVIVPRIISDSVDQSFAIDENETAVVIGSSSEAAATNNVVLTFASTDLPKVTAERGNTTLEIPANTKVTSTWNKELQLPTNLSLDDSNVVSKMNTALLGDNKKVDAVAVRINVGGDEKIQFSQHVTLTLKGQGAKEAGFVDQTGSFTPIKKYADSAIRADEVYAYNDNGDLIIKTKHFTSFLAYSTSALTTSGGGGTVPVAQTVKLSVEKRSLGEGDIVAPVTITIQAGDTAFTALKRALDDKGVALQYTGSEASVYVQSIDGLAELDKGAGSGWMYSVNGIFPQISAGAYTLKNGDVLRWQYTKDLGNDIGGDTGLGGNTETGEQVPGGDNGSSTINYKDAAQISSWAKEAVTKASALGFMQGTSTTDPKFEPKRLLTRAEFAALMVKYSGIDPINEDAGFTDVSSKDWFYGYVAAAKEKGLMSGKSDTSFAPNASISREEVAAVLVRFKGLSDSNAPQAALKDRDAVSAWAVPYVNVAYQTGLMTGDNGRFNPQSFVTREMAAVAIIRLYELK